MKLWKCIIVFVVFAITSLATAQTSSSQQTTPDEQVEQVKNRRWVQPVSPAARPEQPSSVRFSKTCTDSRGYSYSESQAGYESCLRDYSDRERNSHNGWEVDDHGNKDKSKVGIGFQGKLW
ncbi:MAG: hypothetical protein AB7T49_03760 [Oligoflexales bacterium]